MLNTLFVSSTIYGQSTDGYNYALKFGEKYTAAENYLSDNEWILQEFIKNGINPCFAQAIIFPELIRYSAVRDKIEIQGLLTLYVQYGNEFANFSVGPFQMKPGFAEQIEKDALLTPSINDPELTEISKTASSASRLERITRITDKVWQVRYLIWFIKISDHKFANIHWISQDEKLLFYATAYNCGYYHTEKYIRSMMQKKHFHTSIFSNEEAYSYSSISEYFWKNCNNISK